jgi:hypothetical protein
MKLSVRRSTLALGILLVVLLIVGPITVSAETPSAVPAQVYGARLTGAAEVPPVETDANGLVVIAVNDDQTALRFAIVVRGIEDVTVSHIHCGTADVSAPVGVSLPLTNARPIGDATLYRGGASAPDPGNSCGWATLDDVEEAIQSGGAYVNVHSATFPSGEIRGQLVRVGD